MSKLVFDEDGLLDEPCLSCNNAYIEDIWNEWCCDKKECPYNTDIKPQQKDRTVHNTENGG